MNKRGHVPLRRCMGCHRTKKKGDMIRLVKSPDGVFSIDETKQRTGRGYYLCPGRACLKLAQKKIRGLEPIGSMDTEVAQSKGVPGSERFMIEEERE